MINSPDPDANPNAQNAQVYSQGYPNTSSNFLPPRRPRDYRWIWITGVVVIVLLISIFAAFAVGRFTSPASQAGAQATSTTAVSNTPAPNGNSASPGSTGGSTGGSNGGSSGGPTGGSDAIGQQQAFETVSHYYQAINAKDYVSAYNLWGSKYHSSTSYDDFARGFVSTQKDTWQLGSATLLSNGTAKVTITVTATVSSNGTTSVNTYQGYYIVGLEGGPARLLDANLQLTSSSNDRVQQAMSALNQYYAAINAKNYAAAYGLWGSAYHNTTSYNQFASGFSSTQSVTISINNEGISVLKDGSVQIPLTIHASNGTDSHTYQGSYIIGVENSAWRLLSANIH